MAGAATIDNYGMIVGGTYGIKGGNYARTVYNASAGFIAGATGINSGANIANAGTIVGTHGRGASGIANLTNSGTIEGIGGYGILLGGTVVNGTTPSSTALIQGVVGVVGARNMINFGTIVGTDLATSNGVGILGGSYCTVVDAGTITGAAGTAIYFFEDKNRLVLDPGYQLSGNVNQNPASGQIAYADMAGGAFGGWVNVGFTPGWNVAAVSDLTGDGFADIVVQNEAGGGPVAYADMNGGTFNGWGNATTPLPSGYVVADTADVFGNGHADLLVQQQSTGTIYYAAEGSGGFQQWGFVANHLNSNYRVV